MFRRLLGYNEVQKIVRELKELRRHGKVVLYWPTNGMDYITTGPEASLEII